MVLGTERQRCGVRLVFAQPPLRRGNAGHRGYELGIQVKLNLTKSTALILILAALTAISALAQLNEAVLSTCDAKVEASDYSLPAWAENAKVKVYILNADFNPSEIAAILPPLFNWSAIAEGSGSRVTFLYSGTVAVPQDCLNCLTIMRGRVHENQKHAAELHAYVIPGEPIILHALLLLDPIIPNLTALTNAVAHELGHNFGLPDCFSCKGHNTVMGLIRTSDGFVGPTACDVTRVRRIYDHARIQTARLKKDKPARVAKIVPVDEGEEPVDDDTPIVLKEP